MKNRPHAIDNRLLGAILFWNELRNCEIVHLQPPGRDGPHAIAYCLMRRKCARACNLRRSRYGKVATDLQLRAHETPAALLRK